MVVIVVSSLHKLAIRSVISRDWNRQNTEETSESAFCSCSPMCLDKPCALLLYLFHHPGEINREPVWSTFVTKSVIEIVIGTKSCGNKVLSENFILLFLFWNFFFFSKFKIPLFLYSESVLELLISSVRVGVIDWALPWENDNFTLRNLRQLPQML